MTEPPDNEKAGATRKGARPDSIEVLSFIRRIDLNNGQSASDVECLPEPSELAPFMTERDVLSWQVKRAALLALLNIETRSFAEIAASLGVERAAVSVAYTRLCERIGWQPQFRRIATRLKNSTAAARRWRKQRPNAFPPLKPTTNHESST